MDAGGAVADDGVVKSLYVVIIFVVIIIINQKKELFTRMDADRAALADDNKFIIFIFIMIIIIIIIIIIGKGEIGTLPRGRPTLPWLTSTKTKSDIMYCDMCNYFEVKERCQQ